MIPFKKISLGLVLILGYLSLEAQQMSMYTHYMYNTLVVNPAYAGSRDALTVTALNRKQWVNFKGAPLTQTVSMHAPVISKHIGLGMSVMNDRIGPTNNTTAFVDFAFIMRLTDKSKLALGLSGGVNVFSADLNSLKLNEQNDPAFTNNIDKNILPNFGFGAYYSRERFYAGVSVPNLLENSYSGNNQEAGNTLIGKEIRHYYLIAGALFHLSPNLAIKPTTLLKATAAAPVQGDFTLSFIMMEKFHLGTMYRTSNAVGLLAGLDITDQFYFGYSYDWSYGVNSGEYNNGSHELVLRYDFLFNNKKQIRSPRYF
ncbi:MAG: PorP/SprF family type IX secretion system membrane protein [Bacteroidota bacterium]